MNNQIRVGVPASPTPGSTPAPAPDAKKGAPEHSFPPFVMIGPEGNSVVGRDPERARVAVGASRPLYLRPTFNDCYRAFPSFSGMPIFYRGRALKAYCSQTNAYEEFFFIDLYDVRHRQLIHGVIAAHQEIFRFAGEQ